MLPVPYFLRRFTLCKKQQVRSDRRIRLKNALNAPRLSYEFCFAKLAGAVQKLQFLDSFLRYNCDVFCQAEEQNFLVFFCFDCSRPFNSLFHMPALPRL